MELQHNVFFIFAGAFVCHHNALMLLKLIKWTAPLGLHTDTPINDNSSACSRAISDV